MAPAASNTKPNELRTASQVSTVESFESGALTVGQDDRLPLAADHFERDLDRAGEFARQARRHGKTRDGGQGYTR